MFNVPGTAWDVPPETRDMDVDCTSVTSVTRTDHEFTVTLSGGFGYWVDSTTGERTAVRATEALMVFGYAGPERRKLDVLCDAIERVLTRWLESGTPLHACAAPGVCSILVEDEDWYLPIPRTDPEPVEQWRPHPRAGCGLHGVLVRAQGRPERPR